MKNQFYQQLEAARLQEKCRRCVHFDDLDNKCLATRERVSAAQRKSGCPYYRGRAA